MSGVANFLKKKQLINWQKNVSYCHLLPAIATKCQLLPQNVRCCQFSKRQTVDKLAKKCQLLPAIATKCQLLP
jgi:hypothetical protein